MWGRGDGVLPTLYAVWTLCLRRSMVEAREEEGERGCTKQEVGGHTKRGLFGAESPTRRRQSGRVHTPVLRPARETLGRYESATDAWV